MNSYDIDFAKFIINTASEDLEKTMRRNKKTYKVGDIVTITPLIMLDIEFSQADIKSFVPEICEDIVTLSESYSFCADCGIAYGMEEYVMKKTTITNITDSGMYHLECDDGNFYWSYDTFIESYDYQASEIIKGSYTTKSGIEVFVRDGFVFDANSWKAICRASAYNAFTGENKNIPGLSLNIERR